MSVNSDDTDLLVLLPPDLFVVPDETNAEAENSNSCGSFLGISRSMNFLKRCGSAETLSTPSRSTLRPRSLHCTPVKYTPASPFRNILTTESYLTQRQRDEENLREIDEYFNKKLTTESAASPVPKLDLPQVQEILSQVEETEKNMTERNNLHVENARKSLVFDSPEKSLAEEYSEELSIKITNSEPLVSLNNLWTSCVPKASLHEEIKILKQRVEEERLRRQHCENLIRDLQKRLLESQEKMAVAVKVDEEKDSAIKRLKESWSRAVDQWKDADTKRMEYCHQMKEMEEKFNEEKMELLESAKKYEQEMLNALSLVHDYKEQAAGYLKDRDAVAKEHDEMILKLRSVEEACSNAIKQLQDLTSVINEKDAKINELNTSQKSLKKQLKQALVERDKFSSECEEKIALQKKLDEVLKRQGTLQEQLHAAAKVKTDLKQYYQNQVETIVADKQRDFQMQLQNAEKKLLKQYEVKEKDILERVAVDRQKLVESHKREVEIMQEAHRETTEFYKVELALCREKLVDIQEYLEKEKERFRYLPEQLYALAQNHWKETLRLVCPSNDFKNLDLKQVNSPLKRQNTFTKLSEDIENGVSSNFSAPSRFGSYTYRINETPQKIPNQNKDTSDKLGTSSDGRQGSNEKKQPEASKASTKDKSPWK